MVDGLIIGEEQRRQIDELRAVAAATPRDVHGVIAASTEDIVAYRDAMRTMAVFLPGGFGVAYTHEIQPHAPPPGVCHHISVSLDRPGRLPSPEAVEAILHAFGMAPIIASDSVWIEDVSPGERAINVLQLIDQANADG